jgi:hypothetical protein
VRRLRASRAPWIHHQGLYDAARAVSAVHFGSERQPVWVRHYTPIFIWLWTRRYPREHPYEHSCAAASLRAVGATRRASQDRWAQRPFMVTTTGAPTPAITETVPFAHPGRGGIGAPVGHLRIELTGVV